MALLSGAPFDDQSWDLLTNDQIAAARGAINRISGSRRLLGHAVITPNKGPWMAEVDRCIAQVRPDSWKGYTVGDPLSPSKLGTFWRLDDEKLMYPFYEKAVKAGINTICIHKGLLPADYQKSWPQRMAVQHRLGRGEGGKGLAADELRDLSLRAPDVP